MNAFIAAMAPLAQAASKQCGFLPSVILAQWCDETAYGTSAAFVDGHNLAGISPGGRIAAYPSLADGIAAYIITASSSYYAEVRATPGADAQALALGASPWAASHYGSPPGSALVAIITANNLGQYDGANPQPSTSSGGAQVNALDPTSGGTWIVDPSDGHVETMGGAPYLGALNAPNDRYGWEQADETITGITAWPYAGAWGYAIIVRHATPLADGAYFSWYTFRRDGADVG